MEIQNVVVKRIVKRSVGQIFLVKGLREDGKQIMVLVMIMQQQQQDGI